MEPIAWMHGGALVRRGSGVKFLARLSVYIGYSVGNQNAQPLDASEVLRVFRDQL